MLAQTASPWTTVRRVAVAVLLPAILLPAEAWCEDFAWPGHGTIRITVPAGWSVLSKDAGDAGYVFRAQPTTGPTTLAKLTLLALPPDDKRMGAGDVRASLERGVQPYLAGSVEKTFDPTPLHMLRGSGWFVQLTDASLVGKSPEPGNFRVMRSALALLGDDVAMVATVMFDDPSASEVGQAMSLVSSVRHEPSNGSASQETSSSGAFEFTTPESHISVKVPEIGLREDRATGKPRYFKLSRRDPHLILSGWIEPATRYEGLKAFWESESRSPAYGEGRAPTRVEVLRVGPWDVIAFDIFVPGEGTSAHLRAERVQADSWIDLHLSSTSTRAPTALREDLVAVLRSIEVVEK